MRRVFAMPKSSSSSILQNRAHILAEPENEDETITIGKRRKGPTRRTGQTLPLHVFWTSHAGARPYRIQCRVARCDMGRPAHTSHPLSRLFACFAGPILRQSGD